MSVDALHFLLPRLRGRIEEGEAGVPHRPNIVIAAASPTLPSPASGGGDLFWR
jgi:hypothetical protein